MQLFSIINYLKIKTQDLNTAYMKYKHPNIPAGRLITDCTTAIIITTTQPLIAEVVGICADRAVPLKRLDRAI